MILVVLAQRHKDGECSAVNCQILQIIASADFDKWH